MQIKALIRYFGAKGGAAREYPSPLPGLPLIEPFAGSAGYARQHWSSPVYLSDVDSSLMACWKYLQTATPEELFALLRLDLQQGQKISDLPIPEGAQYLIRSWQGISNKVGDKVTQWGSPLLKYRAALRKIAPGMPAEEESKLLRDYVCSTRWGEQIICNILFERPKFRHWKFATCSYQKVPNIRATWFIDPPYRENIGAYRAGADGIDYRDLRDWCLSREGLVVVCEQEGADWLPFEPLGKNRNRIHRDKTNHKSKMEMIWTKSNEQT